MIEWSRSFVFKTHPRETIHNRKLGRSTICAIEKLSSTQMYSYQIIVNVSQWVWTFQKVPFKICSRGVTLKVRVSNYSCTWHTFLTCKIVLWNIIRVSYREWKWWSFHDFPIISYLRAITHTGSKGELPFLHATHFLDLIHIYLYIPY